MTSSRQSTEADAVAQPADVDYAPPSAWYALFVLTVVLMFATVDRAILSLLAEPIKHSLGLSDLELGFVQGTGIAVFTAIAAFPLAWMADRYGRRIVLAGSVVVWSTAVVFCGLANSFGEILLASAMVGAGEAGLAPITYAMIAELFRGRKRQLANSIFVVAAATGGGIAMITAGQLVGLGDSVRSMLPAPYNAWDSWRISFFMAALPAPLMVILVFTIRHVRHQVVARIQGLSAVAATTLRSHIVRHRQTLLPFFMGIALAIFAFSAIGSWLAVILIRLFGETAARVGAVQGGISMGAIAIGFLLTAYGLRVISARLGPKTPIRTIWVSVLLATVTSSAMAFATSAHHIYAIQFIQAILLTAANMLFPTALQDLAPANLRGRVVAIQTTINVGFTAAAAPTVGLVSDLLKPREDALLVAACIVAVCGLLASVVLLRVCERRYPETVRAIREEDPDAMPVSIQPNAVAAQPAQV